MWSSGITYFSVMELFHDSDGCSLCVLWVELILLQKMELLVIFLGVCQYTSRLLNQTVLHQEETMKEVLEAV